MTTMSAARLRKSTRLQTASRRNAAATMNQRAASEGAHIERVEILQVDLPPKVVRTDAIQSFVKQETPIVRITCSDGAQGVGYTYTIGTGGSSVVALLRDHLVPAPDRSRCGANRRDMEGSFLPHARHGGGRDHEPRARGDRHRAVGLEVPPRESSRCGRSPAAPRPQSRCTRPRAAGFTIPRSRSSTRPSPRKRRDSRAPSSRSASRRSPRTSSVSPAVRDAVGDEFELMIDANQAFTVARGAAPRPRLRAARRSPGSRSRCRPRTSRATSKSRPRHRCRSRSANRSITRRTSASTWNATPARSSRSIARASAASRRGSRWRTSPRRSTSRCARIS